MKGARVANLPLSPVMAFIDTSQTIVGVEIQQIYTRYIEVGQDVEVTFKVFPGQVYKGRVESVLEATSAGQVVASGTAVTARQVTAAPLVVRVKLDVPGLPPVFLPARPVMLRSTPSTSSRATSSAR
jgi:multidrug resistance efflux pump